MKYFNSSQNPFYKHFEGELKQVIENLKWRIFFYIF